MKQESKKIDQSNLASRIANLAPAKRALLEQQLKEKGLASLVRQTIPRRAKQESAVLSFAQQRLWFLDQYEPNSSVYNLTSALRLKGRLKIGALEQSINEIVWRHEALRTVFSMVEGEPVQLITPSVNHPLLAIDLRGRPESEREEEVRRLSEEEARRPFDLARGPLFRSSLLRLGEDDQVLLLTMHHIVSDGWSMGVLYRELSVLYRASMNDEPSPLADLPIQYADFAVWQREWLQGEVLDSQLSYWKKQLEGIPAVLNLPTDRPWPAVQSFRGKRQSIELSKELTEGLKALSRKEGVTLFMTLLAAFQALLYRYTGQEDIVVGSPIANRNRAEIEGLIGFFVNTLVLRSNFDGNPTFKELLARVREMALGAYAHQDLPFEKLVEELKPERSLSYSPLFQVMFVLQNAPSTALTFEGLSASPVGIGVETAKFDLTLTMSESIDGLRGSLQYSIDLFDDATIARMIGHLQTLLEGIVANPDQRISQLPVLTQAEEHQLFIECNDTKRDYPKEKCIHELFEAQVEKSPDAVAVAFEDQRLTYRELNARANQLAHYLQKLEVGPEVRVGICMERSLEMVIALLGILKSGGAYVPLDPEYPKERLAFMLEDARPAVLVTQERLLEKFPHPHARIVCLDRDWGQIAKEKLENTKNKTTVDDVAYVIYTSGTTGQPKGVIISHHNIGRLFRATESWFHFSKNDVWTMFHSYAFDFSVWEIWGALLYGGRVVVVPFWITRSPEKFYELLCREEVTVLNQTPSAFRQLIHADQSISNQTDLALRLIIFGGEALDFQSLRPWLDRHGDQYPQLVNMYGITETTVHVTYRVVRSTDVKQGVGSLIGVPLPDLDLYVLNEHRQLVPIGIPGELYVGGAGVGRGYLNRPELTGERFIANPFSDRKTDKLYKTGDLVRRLSNGDIEYLGRTDAQVKMRGFRIELGEIESVLGQHPAVREAVVLAREETPGDPSASPMTDKRLVAYVVPRNQQACTTGELRNFLKQKLPDYMIPTAFVLLDVLPLTSNGKIDRNALPAPDQSRPEIEERYVAPGTPIEELLAEIWAHVLKVERVGIHDNFFDLGGHSLLATQVMSRLRELFQVDLPLRSLFESPTVAGLAESIEDARRKEQHLLRVPIVPVPREGELPLSFSQQRLWFLDQYEPNSSVYNISSALRLRGSLDIGALEQNLNEIISRHESLRTTFSMVDGEAVQVIAPSVEFSLAVVDLSDHPEGEREEEAQRLVHEEARRPFDLAQGPLFRSKLVRLGEDNHVLLLMMHHIVSDGWSIGVLHRELSMLYQAFVNGHPSPLAEFSIQYADYAVWQREWLKGPELERQLTYWKKQLEGAPGVLNLPTDHPRPAVQSYRGARQSIELSKELTQGLKALSRKEGVTLFMTLLAAFQTLLYRYTGQEDIVVGSPIANRNRSEIEGLIGFFVNTLVLRTDLSENPNFVELLHRVRKAALEAYDHQDLPFEKLVEEFKPERSLSHSPLFQVMFVLQNASGTVSHFDGLSVSPVRVRGETAKFDLTLFMQDGADGLRGALQYSTDLFNPETINRMLGHFEVLLESIITDPNQPISALPILTVTEKHQLLVEWNDTEKDYPRGKCLHQLFEEQVERSPDTIAVVFEDQQLTYRDLNARANQLAHHLKKRGVGPDVLVGICVERSLAMLVALLAIMKAGGAYVPLDPEYPEARLAWMLEDSEASTIVAGQRFAGRFPEHQAIVWLDDECANFTQESLENPVNIATPASLAYVIYTSGSTGTPKGVMIEHRSVVNYLYWFNHAALGDNFYTLPVITNFTFDASLKQLFAPLLRARQVWMLPEEVISEPSVLVKTLGTRSGTDLNCVPTLWNALLDAMESKQTPLRSEALSVLLLGGEKLNRSLADRTLAVFPHVAIWNLYGPTEATANAIAGKISREGPITLGKPIDNTEVVLLDANLQPVPVGVTGELYIGGVGLARGYLGRPDLTAEKFIPHPFSNEPGARLYKTGDLVRYLADGNIEFLGRIDQQVKVRGFRIELGEIESALAQHSAVQEVAVLAREDVPGKKRLVAYVVLAKQQVLTSTELRTFVKAKLPDYMVPSVFVFLDSLPLTPNGKVDRKALPVPDGRRLEQDENVSAPRTPVEEMLAGVWAEILKLDNLSIHDNFFDLGGHSLLATQVVSRVNQAFQVELPLRKLFESPTVAGLAERIEELRRKDPKLRTLPIVSVSREKDLPVSFSQQRLWFLNQLEPHNSVYNIPGAHRLNGPLDIPALERALNEIVRRHEVLRTTFSIVEGRPVQRISPSLSLALACIDLGQLPETEREAAVRRHANEEGRRPFDLERGPLVRSVVLRLGSEDHVLLLTLHHIASDGWSMGVLFRELSVLYEAFAHGKSSPLADLAIQYADYAVWQREWLEGAVLGRQLSYWKTQLDNISTLQLPTDRPRPAAQSFRGAKHPLILTQELTEELKKLSRREGVTLFMTLLAAFQTLLQRYTGQDDITVGSPIAGRTRQEVEGLIGLFINTLVLRSDFSGEPTFKEVLRRVREMALSAYTHQDVPFEKLVEELHPQRDLSRSPLFQVMFVLQNVPTRSRELGDLKMSAVTLDGETAKFDLTLTMHDGAQGLRGLLHYNTDLFDDATTARMLSHFKILLESITANPERPLYELLILTNAEKQRFVAEWNASEKVDPADKCVSEMFEAQVARTPNAVAVIFETQQWSYQELNTRANQIAHYLRKLAVKPGVIVGVCIERSLEMISAILGILKAGGTYLPLDASYPKERLAFMLDDAHAMVLLTQERIIESLPKHFAEVVCLDRDWGKIARESNENVENTADFQDLAYVIYTSGSTGTPKGVMISQESIANHCKSIGSYYRLDDNDRVLQFASVNFDASLEQILPTLISGARLVLRDNEIPSPADLHKKIYDSELTVINLPTTYWHQFVKTTIDLPESCAASRLRLVIVGGEEMLPEAAKLWQQSPHSRFRLLNAYGPTEATITATAFAISPASANSLVCRMVPIGRPLGNRQLFVLGKQGSLVPTGVVGELYIGGPRLARGYLNRPDLTAEKFIPHPFSNEPGARLYKTGDLVRYLADGNIEFLGRIDQQVKVRGFRIELGEIESALAHHSAVQEVAVLAREDVPGEKRLVAYVVLAKQQVLTSTELRTFVKAKLPDYMVPSVFVFLDSLPLTPNGKVDRKALPVPDQSKTDLQKSFVAPRTAVEETLARIWAEVLKVECVGIHDNFFELGGDSILTIQIVARAHREGLRLTPKQMFQHQTIAELAAVVGTNSFLSAQQGVVTGKLPLTAIQRRFFEANFPAPHHWNMAMLLEARQVLNPNLLERAVQQLVLHHDALRMRFFCEQQSGWQQEIVQPQESSVFSYIDLSGLEDAEQEGAIKLAAAELQAGLNLSEGPLMRVALFDLGSKQNSRLLLIVHHLVVDGVSLRILIEDLQIAYQQLSEERPVALPAKTTSFKQWAERITEYARSSSVKKEIDYWLTSSNGQVFHLPVDHAGGANTEVSARTVSVSLTDKETQALLHEVPKTYHSQINDVLLTALVQAFSAWTGKASLLIELEGHGREEIFEDLDLSRTVGWFTTCFPVYLEIQSSSGPGEALKLIKEQLRSVPNRGIGFGLLYYLSESTAIAEPLRGLPQPEISFNYLGQFDQVLPPSSPFVWGTKSAGPTRNPFGNRRQLLAVTGRVKQDRLMVNWTYSENLYRRATIERLAQSFVNALRDLISHSQSPQAEAYTPSDFPGAKLSQKDLDGLIAKLRETGARKST